MTYRIAIVVGRLLVRVLGLRISPCGLEHVPRSGGAVLAVTHFGYLDFALLQWGIWRRHRRVVRFLVMRKAFEHPLAGPLLRAMGHIPVDSACGALAYRQALRAVASGELVGVFPEGRVSRSWTLLPLRPGAAAIAQRTGVPLLPVVVWGGHRLLTRGRRPAWREVRGTDVHVELSAPLPLSGDRDHSSRRLASVLRSRLARVQMVGDRPDAAWWVPRHLGGSAPTPEQAWAEDRRAGIVADSFPGLTEVDPDPRP